MINFYHIFYLQPKFYVLYNDWRNTFDAKNQGYSAISTIYNYSGKKFVRGAVKMWEIFSLSFDIKMFERIIGTMKARIKITKIKKNITNTFV